MNKVILVFIDGELHHQINYKTRLEAVRNYKHFVRNGIIDATTGLPIKNATFELL